MNSSALSFGNSTSPTKANQYLDKENIEPTSTVEQVSKNAGVTKNEAENNVSDSEFYDYIRQNKWEIFRSRINSAYITTLRFTNVSHSLT